MIRSFLAYENPDDSFEIDGLHISNQSDRIVLTGELHFTKDKAGLSKVLELKRVIDAAASVLKHKDIPEQIEE